MNRMRIYEVCILVLLGVVAMVYINVGVRDGVDVLWGRAVFYVDLGLPVILRG